MILDWHLMPGGLMGHWLASCGRDQFALLDSVPQ
jgi:hypothetical protein